MPRTTDKCKSCNGSLMSTHGNANFCSHDCRKTDRRKKHAEWRAQNPGPGRGVRVNKKWTKDYRAKWNREYQLRSRYGLSMNDAKALDARTAGPCDICGRVPWGTRRHAIDHCHETGAIRGVLCAQCNTSLGVFGDDAEGITNVLNYLSRENKPDVHRSQLTLF